MEAGAFVGIDAAARHLDAAVHEGGAPWRVAHDEAGIAALVARVAALAPALVVLEATGGLETVLAGELAAAGLPVAVVNPRQVREFARATGRRAKTDALEARVLAHVAAAVRPAPRALPDADAQELAALVARRRQLSEMLVAEQLRLRTASRRVRPQSEAHVAWLRAPLGELDGELRRVIAAGPAWRAKDDPLRSVPGVGPVVAAALLGGLRELGTLGGRQAAALVGVAPLNCDSGAQRGHRAIAGGRGRARAALDMATVVGVRHNPVLRAFHERLRAGGKPPKVALTACTHKLLLILNAMRRDGTPWAPPAPAGTST